MKRNLLILSLLLTGCDGGSGGGDNTSNESHPISNCMDGAEWSLIKSEGEGVGGRALYGWQKNGEQCSPDWSLDPNAELIKKEIYEYSQTQDSVSIMVNIKTVEENSLIREGYIKEGDPSTMNPTGYYTIKATKVDGTGRESFEFGVAEGNNYWTGQPLLTISRLVDSQYVGSLIRCDGYDGNTMTCENGTEVKNSDVMALIEKDENGQYTYDYGVRLMKLLGLTF